MKSYKIIASIWLSPFSGGFAPARPAAKPAASATTPLIFANTVSFFKVDSAGRPGAHD